MSGTLRRTARLLSCILLGSGVLAVLGSAPDAQAATIATDVVAHTFNVALGGTATFTIELPTSFTPEVAASAVFQVTSYERADSAVDVERAVDGTLPRAVDVAEIAPANVTVSSDGRQATIAVAIEAQNNDDDTLQFSRPGVYPVQIEAIAGERRAAATTFVNRLAASGTPPEPINVAMVVHVAAGIRLDGFGTQELLPGSAEALAAAAGVLTASKLPVGVAVDPSALARAGASDPALVGAVASSLDGDQVVSAPSPPLDASAATAGGATDVYTEWLRAGEDSLAATTGVSARRSVAIAGTPLSTAAITMLRDLGTRLLILSPDDYDAAEGSLGVFTDSSQLVSAELEDGGRLPVAVVDRNVTRWFDEGDEVLDRRATNVAALVLAQRQYVVDQLGDPTRHTLVLGRSDLGVPDQSLVEALTALLTSTPGIAAVPIDEIVDTTEALLFDGRPVVIRLPDVEPGHVAERIELRDTLDAEARSTATMFVGEPDTLTEWLGRSSLLPSTALADPDAVVLADDLRADFSAVRDAVELPAPFGFTLTGDENTIPLRFTNTSTRPLAIRVRLIAPRLIVPDGDSIVELAPNAVTTLEVKVRTRSNGQSPVSLDVFTPDGQIQIGERVPLSARVTNLSGVGNLVTGVAVLMLFTWWFRHWWRNRRPDDTDGSEDGTDDDSGGGTDGELDALSPDAATSTLPHS
jgi:hypothetical protein